MEWCFLVVVVELSGQNVVEVIMVDVVIGCLVYGQSVFVGAQVEIVTMLVTMTVLVFQPRRP